MISYSRLGIYRKHLKAKVEKKQLVLKKNNHEEEIEKREKRKKTEKEGLDNKIKKNINIKSIRESSFDEVVKLFQDGKPTDGFLSVCS